MMQVTVLHPIPSPYREKLFAELASSEHIDLVVYYCARSVDSYRDWQFHAETYCHEVLHGYKLSKGLIANPGIVSRMAKNRPHIIIVWGWSHPTAQMALLTARLLGIPALVFSDSAWPVHQWRSPISTGLIRQYKRLIIRTAQSFLAQGKLAKQYLLSFGVSADRVHIVPINCVDTKVFRNQAEIAHSNLRQTKERLGIHASRVILYTGRLVPGKGLPILLDAYAELRKGLSDVALLFVGGGPEKISLESNVIRRGLPDVHFVGPRPYYALPEFYGLSDCLVLPTFSDTWGLVVLEALACGLPVVTTTRCGSVPDLIEGRQTGLVVEPGNASALAQAIGEILSLPSQETEAMSHRALDTAVEYDCRLAAKRLTDVLTFELERYTQSA